MAARHKREHQRVAASVLPQGHRHLALKSRGRRRGRRRAQQPTSKGPRLAYARGGPRRTPTLRSTNRCCIHHLNPVSFVHAGTSAPRKHTGSSNRWDVSHPPGTTPRSNRSLRCCRTTCSTGRPRRPARTSPSRSSAGSRRTTGAAVSVAWAASPPESSRPRRSVTRPSQHDQNNLSTEVFADPDGANPSASAAWTS